ncbi:hypothetical protein ACJ7K1_26945 [Paenibacillus elgii]
MLLGCIRIEFYGLHNNPDTAQVETILVGCKELAGSHEKKLDLEIASSGDEFGPALSGIEAGEAALER